MGQGQGQGTSGQTGLKGDTGSQGAKGDTGPTGPSNFAQFNNKTNGQGPYIGWNNGCGDSAPLDGLKCQWGATNFVNQIGTGTGGFNFSNYNHENKYLNTEMNTNGKGDLQVSNNVKINGRTLGIGGVNFVKGGYWNSPGVLNTNKAGVDPWDNDNEKRTDKKTLYSQDNWIRIVNDDGDYSFGLAAKNLWAKEGTIVGNGGVTIDENGLCFVKEGKEGSHTWCIRNEGSALVVKDMNADKKHAEWKQ